MRLFLDTELNEFEGDLISIALVSEDGAEWYRINDSEHMVVGEWVKTHVMTHLHDVTEPTTVTHLVMADMADDLRLFLADYRDAEIIADWPADFEHFASLLSIIGAVGGFKEAFPCTMKLINTPELKPEVQHNALSDARALRDWYMQQDSNGNEMEFDLVKHLERQRNFSLSTFGPGARTDGVCDHIEKELKEVKAKPDDLEEWVDVILLALDGAWRSGHNPLEICKGIAAKQTKNEKRDWPDWRTVPEGKAIEHKKTAA